MAVIIDFLKYLVTKVVIRTYEDIRDIVKVVTQKQTWVLVWFVMIFVSFFILKSLYWSISSIVLFFLFWAMYEWQRFYQKRTEQERDDLRRRGLLPKK